MSDFFLKILNMSAAASWVVLAVLLLRFILKRAPKWITVLLWGIVAVRLICPFSIESAISLIPSAETISPEIMMDKTPEIDTGISSINNIINPLIGSSLTPAPGASANPLQIWIPILSFIWMIGIAALLTYTFISYYRIKKKIGTAVLLRGNIYQSESVLSPFVLGIIKAKIYLPFSMNEQAMEHVIAHEQAHIHRKDHWWKPLGFLLLILHWFNPLIWLAYALLCRDIEFACDEKAVKKLNHEQRADYSQALLTCSIHHRMIAACPLAFGEVGVKHRVKSVLNDRKPAFWLVLAAVIVSIAAAVCFLTNPIPESDSVIKKLTSLKGYEVIEQNTQKITLSIPVSDLPADIFSEDGKEFSPNEMIAYQDDTAAIFLKEALYSNTGNDILYFCFDFTFHLPKKQGKTIYPFEISNNGLRASVQVADGILRADNAEFDNAVILKGRGPNELIWFCVSTDALKQAQGTLSFDIYINEITYFSNADDYHSASNASDSETSIPTLTASEMEQLKDRFPMYFALDASEGLQVYIWQLAKGSYSCGLLPGKNRSYTQEELWNLQTAPASLEEMRAIVASYLPAVSQSDVVISPIQMPYSSYAYNIDETYREKLNNLFWSDAPTLPSDIEPGFPDIFSLSTLNVLE